MVFEKVSETLASQLDVEESEITMETKLVDDLKADSLDLVDLIMTFEDDFGIEFPEDQTENIKTVGDIVNYIEASR